MMIDEWAKLTWKDFSKTLLLGNLILHWQIPVESPSIKIIPAFTVKPG
jgi:hypothetical protein